MEPISASLLLEIASVIKEIYSLYDNMNALLEKKGKKRLEIALTYLNDPNLNADKGLIRQALQHMESAYTLLDEKPFFNAEERTRRRNDLCYYIAKLHHELGDPYNSTTRYWALKIDDSITPQDEFKKILNDDDWIEISNRHIDYLKEKERLGERVQLDFDPDDYDIRRTLYD